MRTHPQMNLLKASANHLVSCPTDAWLATYTKYTDIKEWSAVEWDALRNHVQKTLEEKKVLNASGWESIREVTLKETQDAPAFQSIADIAKAVCEAAVTFQSTLRRTTVVKCGSHDSTDSEVPGLSTKVHFLLARPERTPFRATDTALTTQFKSKDSRKTCEQNEARLLSNVHYILSNDPRRRFTFGLTIEGDTMRLWHFSHSHIAVTDDLDYHEHPEHFIHFLLFFLFAPATALGFDPTVHRVVDEQNEIAYLYEVGGSWYQTVGKPLSEQNRPRIVHGATRVWSVRKVLTFDSEGNRRLDENTVVLKDVWPFDDAQGEKEIQDAIFNNLRKLDEGKPESGTPESLAEKAKKYFVTILEDELVQVRGRNDTTSGPPQLYRPMQFEHFWAQSGYSIEHTERTIRHRTHRRVIFKERCDTISNLYDFRELLQCLRHNIQGLWYMRLAGYVHRDISSGNCMWYRAEGQGKISDLEFATPYDQVTPHGPRMGTPQFMAVESQYQDYVLLPSEVPDEELDDLVFTFNFLHDLESILWILLWFLFYRIPDPLVEQLELPALDGLEGAQQDSNHPHDPITDAQLSTLRAQHDTIEEMSRALFDCGLTGSSQRSTFVKSGDYRPIRRTLKPLYPDCFPLTEGILFVAKLNEAYKTLEASQPVINSRGILQWEMAMFTYTPYEQFRQVLQEVLGYIDQSGKTAITPLYVLLPPATQGATKSRQKRSRDTVDSSSIVSLEIDGPPSKKVKT